MDRPKVLSTEQISAKIPEDPHQISEFIRQASNFVAYIEDKWLTELVYKKDELKNSIAAIEAARNMRRDEYIGNNMEEIPKDFRKSATAANQYVDYNIFAEETKAANAELVVMKKELAISRAKITAWQAVKEQYERAIQSATMVLAWEKAQLKLGG